ncbi:MAG: chemotaxis protein CheR [Alphaproteobacteria bacterium]|nr:MAG: chemotaxis protein CheR [Alphaproteobacteria bacterium]
MSVPARERSPRPAGGEIPLPDAAFRAIAARIHALTGIVLRDHKRQMVSTRLGRRLRALGLADYDSYLALLDGPQGAAETVELINALTTNLTSFFREAHHFADLRAAVIAPRIAARAGRLRIWSAGCSTGEEPYSIQMTMLEAGALDRPWDYRLLATDLDSAVLARAEAGVYAADRLAGVPPALRAGAFRARPDGSFEVVPALKAAVRFRRLNLLDPWPFRGPFDAIFCRNVLIYFDAATKAALVDRFAEMLTPDGTLYLGHSESLLGDHPRLRPCGRTIYRRRA